MPDVTRACWIPGAGFDGVWREFGHIPGAHIDLGLSYDLKMSNQLSFYSFDGQTREKLVAVSQKSI